MDLTASVQFNCGVERFSPIFMKFNILKNLLILLVQTYEIYLTLPNYPRNFFKFFITASTLSLSAIPLPTDV